MELVFLCWKSTCKYIYLYIYFFFQLYRYPILVLQIFHESRIFLCKKQIVICRNVIVFIIK